MARAAIGHRDKLMPTPTGIIAFSPSTPAAPTGSKNVTPQTDGGSPLQKFSFNYDATYDVIFAYIGQPPNAYVVQLIAFPIGVTFPANFANSVGFCGTNPTATATYTLKKNHSGAVTTVGTVVVSTGGAFTFASTGGAAQSFVAGDVLEILTPVADLTLADVTFTLHGYKT